MKKVTAAALALSLALLSGCSGGSIYANYREIDRLLIIQTIGIDRGADGGVVLSISAGRLGGEPSVCMRAEGPSISEARDLLQNYAPNEVLFYSHINCVVIGEGAAKAGIGKYLDYIQRSVDFRLDTPIFLVKGGNAGDLVMGAAGESRSVTDVLESVKWDVEQSDGGKVYTAAEIAEALSFTGAALVCCVECAAETGADPNAENSEVTAIPSGCGILMSDALAGYISPQETRGLNFLSGSTGSGTMELSAGKYRATVSMDGAEASLEPVWAEDGSIKFINASVKLRAGIAELGYLAPLDENCLTALDGALADEARGWINSALARSKTLSADFAGLGRVLELDFPVKYRAMPRSFTDQLPDIIFNVSVTARVGRTYDLENPAGLPGGAK